MGFKKIYLGVFTLVLVAVALTFVLGKHGKASSCHHAEHFCTDLSLMEQELTKLLQNDGTDAAAVAKEVVRKYNLHFCDISISDNYYRRQHWWQRVFTRASSKKPFPLVLNIGSDHSGSGRVEAVSNTIAEFLAAKTGRKHILLGSTTTDAKKSVKSAENLCAYPVFTVPTRELSYEQAMSFHGLLDKTLMPVARQAIYIVRLTNEDDMGFTDSLQKAIHTSDPSTTNVDTFEDDTVAKALAIRMVPLDDTGVIVV